MPGRSAELERQAAEAAHRFQIILDAIPAPIWLKDAAGIYIGCNVAFEEYIGLPRERIVGQSVFGVSPADLAERYRAADEELLRTAGQQSYETEVRYADGLRRRVVMRKSVFRDTSGRVAGLAGTMIDVSAQRQAESEQREAAARARTLETSFRALVEAAPILVAIHRDEQLLYANPALLRLLDTDATTLQGTSLIDWVHPDDRSRLQGQLPPLSQSERELEVRLASRGGRPVDVDLSWLAINFEGAPAWVAIGRDLTERRQAQAQLALSERLASIGRLAAGVAHELNNPLTYVLSNLSFAADELGRRAPSALGDEPEGRKDLLAAIQEARQGAEQMRVIIRDLRALSRPDAPIVGNADLRSALAYASNLAASQIRPRARLVVEVGALPPVRGSEARLGQVFLNLLVNAAQAIPLGDPAGNLIRLRAQVTGDRRVVVEVRDSGTGMTAEVRERIFDPFFTTKPAGEGTGLGLWVCHNLVKAHGGDIEVESAPGEGSTFRVLLPIAEAAEARGPPASPPGPQSPRRRILVIDDEPFVGAAVRRDLAADYDVEVVIGGAEALRRLDEGLACDAVVCDVMMPDLGGLELREEIARRKPELARRVLFITGGPDTAEGARLAASGVPWLEKPFDRAELLAAIEARLSAGR